MSEPSSGRHTDGTTDRGLLLWFVAALFAVFLFTAIVFAWATRHALANGPLLSSGEKRFVLTVADFPTQLRNALYQVGLFGGAPSPLLFPRKLVDGRHWVRRFPAPEDSGFLLFSGVDAGRQHSLVKLLRVSDGAEIARWDPDWDAIYRHITDKPFAQRGSPRNARAFHPLPMPNGDIVFNTANAMVRLGPCSGEPVWVLDQVMHHSNQLDGSGTIWSASVSPEGFTDNPWLHERVRDDAIARVSPDGKILERLSFARILRSNGLGALLFGTGGSMLQVDPIHLNEIEVAPGDTKYWKRGDLLASTRHLSSVFLYRPSTGKIVWQKMGPWLNQHSAHFLDDHRISVFDNNVYGGAPNQQPFVTPGEVNRVFVYDFATGELSQPYAALLAQARPVTYSEGRARILPDGGLFLEETNFGRILRFTRDRLLWSYVNDYGNNRIGILSWSRYLTAEEAQPLLHAISGRACANR